jgi:hypothetical protein
MGLLSGIGAQARGLLGSDAFLDRLAQAQAYARGDPKTAAARTEQVVREWREKFWKDGQTQPNGGARSDFAGGFREKRVPWRPAGSLFGGPR